MSIDAVPELVVLDDFADPDDYAFVLYEDTTAAEVWERAEQQMELALAMKAAGCRTVGEWLDNVQNRAST
jgi:hypothetical protein